MAGFFAGSALGILIAIGIGLLAVPNPQPYESLGIMAAMAIVFAILANAAGPTTTTTEKKGE